MTISLHSYQRKLPLIFKKMTYVYSQIKIRFNNCRRTPLLWLRVKLFHHFHTNLHENCTKNRLSFWSRPRNPRSAARGSLNEVHWERQTVKSNTFLQSASNILQHKWESVNTWQNFDANIGLLANWVICCGSLNVEWLWSENFVVRAQLTIALTIQFPYCSN